jgi:radical SAM superfamily enzyme YgiQ (UPF0313 family)
MPSQGIKRELVLISPAVSNPFNSLVAKLLFQVQFPVALLILCALTPPEYKVKTYYQKLFWFKRDFRKGLLVGITCLTSSADNAYKLAERFRRAGSFVVMGGPHVTAMPDEALRYCDSVVIGEAESVWPQVIKDFEGGALKEKYSGEPLDDFLSPTLGYFLNKASWFTLLKSGISFSRGCKYNCEFCSLAKIKLRYAPIDSVMLLIGRLKGTPFSRFLTKLLPVVFLDDNIFSSPAYAKELFRRLIPLTIRWSSQSSVDIAFDDEALSLARQSGCQSLLIGFETIYPQRLQKLRDNKMVSTDDILAAVKKIKSYGINVVGAFIIGFDYYRHRDYWQLLSFFFRSLWRASFFIISMTMLTPFPGSALFERLRKEGRIKTLDWRKYDFRFHVVFRPKTMSSFSLQAWFWITRIAGILCSSVLIFVVAFFLGCQLLAKFIFIFLIRGSLRH